MFEFRREIDADKAHVLWKGQGNWGKVHDARDPGGNELVGRLLGVGGGHGDHAELNAFSMHDFGEIRGIVDRNAFDLAADDAGIAVECGHDAEALGWKSLVPQEGAAHIADADHRDGPLAIGAEDAADFSDEFVAAVADAGVAEVAEIGEVLADLGVGEAEERGELAGAHGSAAGADQVLEFAQVEAEPADHYGRDVARARWRLWLRGVQRRPDEWGCGVYCEKATLL